MNQKLADKLKNLPNSAGVYFHKNSKGEIIYVGKAANLKNRVRSYFRNPAQLDNKTQALVAEIEMTDWLEVETELDALFLESELIKRYKPQYNILLRDDKSPTYVRIDFGAETPNVSFTKLPSDDGAEYFGPFYAGNSIRKAVRLLRKIFPFYENEKLPSKNNLNSQIGLTPGLENFEKCSVEFEEKMRDYKKSLRNFARYLKGERSKIQKEIENEMKILAFEQRFEEAAKKRDQLRDLSELGRQVIFSRDEFLDISKDYALAKIAEIFNFKTPPRRIEAFDISHLGGENVVASMVVFTNGLANKQEYRKFKMRTGGNDDFTNMREVLTRRFSARNAKWGTPDLILIDGGKGQLAAAFEVLESFENAKIPVVGVAKRDEEIVVHMQKSNIETSWFEAQIHNSNDKIRVVKEGDFYLANLHGQVHSHGHARNLLGENSNEFGDLIKLFQRIRDESHRFAINYHTIIRKKSQTKNQLENISGIGSKTRTKLMKQFGSLKKIREASQEELSKVVGEKLAQKIKQEL